jgi:SAM-dependent methyltransferase
MNELSRRNPTTRFGGLADTYAKYRPTYPDSAIDHIVERCGLSRQSRLVDVGCGTGISSRIFAARGIPVIGIEPNAGMRETARNEPVAADTLRPEYRDGRAEVTGLPTNFADTVVAAQAFHWFEPEPALAEFHRILRPGGWVVLMWNERDENDPFTGAYGAVIRTGPDTAAVEGPRGRAGEVLLGSSLFEDASRVSFANQQVVDEEGVLGRAFSCSYAPRDPAGVANWASALKKIFEEYQTGGCVALRYETSLYLAHRRE